MHVLDVRARLGHTRRMHVLSALFLIVLMVLPGAASEHNFLLPGATSDPPFPPPGAASDQPPWPPLPRSNAAKQAREVMEQWKVENDRRAAESRRAAETERLQENQRRYEQQVAWERDLRAEQQQRKINTLLMVFLAVAGLGFFWWAGRRSLPWLRTYIGQPANRKARKGWARFSGWWLADN